MDKETQQKLTDLRIEQQQSQQRRQQFWGVNNAKTMGLQKAFDNLPSTGGMVFMPTGDYEITSPIKVGGYNKRVILTGTGEKSRIINKNTSAGNAIEILDGTRRSTFENFSIIGATGGGNGIYAKGTTLGILGVKLADLYITNVGLNGIHLEGSTGGITLTKLSNIRVDSATRRGYYYQTAGYVNAENCYASSCGAGAYAGHHVEGSSVATLIDCAADSGYIGYYLKDSKSVLIGCAGEVNTEIEFEILGTGTATLINCFTNAHPADGGNVIKIHSGAVNVNFIGLRTISTASTYDLEILNTATGRIYLHDYDLDQGASIASGVMWYSDDRAFTGSAAPTAGTWIRGSIVWNYAPSAGGTPGWVCTAAGTPGTWKAMANVAA